MDRITYRVVVEGELGPRYASAFEGMRIEWTHGRTAIVGEIADQPQLQGLLARIASLGLSLVSVTPEGSAAGCADEPRE